MKLFVVGVALAVLLVEVSATPYLSKMVLNGKLSEVLQSAQSVLQSRIMKDKRMLPVPNSRANLHLDDIFFHINDDTTAELYNVTLSSQDDLTLAGVKPDLGYMNMEVEVDLSWLKIQGDFEVASSSVLHIMPLTTIGQFSLNLSDLKATGRVGLKLVGNTLSTINYDIDYQPADMFLSVWYNTKDGAVVSTVNTKHFEGTLLKKIDREVKYVLNKFLKNELDKILEHENIPQLIGNNRMMDIYRAHVREQTGNANAYVDALLENAREFLAENNMQQISIPGFRSTFSNTILLVTWHGEFSVSGGYLNNLATIKRTNDVSLSYEDDGSLIVFGSFGMGELQMGYASYVAKFMGLGPSGSLGVDVGGNSLFLKVTANLKEGISVKVNDIRVEHISGLQIHITGLGILDWLISKIATWIAGFFNEQIVDTVNSFIWTAVDQILPNVNPNLYFN